jgi:hypothetical protein
MARLINIERRQINGLGLIARTKRWLYRPGCGDPADKKGLPIWS